MIYMSKSSDRLKSLESWPVTCIDVIKVVQSGLYYNNCEDFLQCHECDEILGEWTQGQDPDTRHNEVNPNCPFMRTKRNNISTNHNRNLIYNTSTNPKIPNQTHPETRCLTFSTWPYESCIAGESLARAGFIYLGFGDETMCFHCGGILNDWEDTYKDPWLEHACEMPLCKFLIGEKGHDFVKMAYEDRTGEAYDVESIAGSLERMGVHVDETERQPRGNDDVPEERTDEVQDSDVEILEPNESRPGSSGETTELTSESHDRDLVSEVLDLDLVIVEPECVQLPRPEMVDVEVSTDRYDVNIQTCKLCFEDKHMTCCVPCGHVVACVSCAVSLNECPFCRAVIDKTVPLYFC